MDWEGGKPNKYNARTKNVKIHTNVTVNDFGKP